MNMFNIESYVTPILLSYVDKYVRDFKPADAQVSLWAGGVTLHNLVLKADVLQREVALPFTLLSGRIHELLIQVPWTKIMSEPIVVTINTIECILSLNPPPNEVPIPETYRASVVEAPPGYMRALVRRVVSNIAVRVNSLIVKYVHDDVVLSLNVKRLAVDSVGADWEPAFADIDQKHPAIRRLVRLDDLTLCLDKSDADGKIRFYHEPLLYRCQLELRVLTRLVSASTRRVRSLSVRLSAARLAWGVTDEQLLLLLRLLRERAAPAPRTPPPAPDPPHEAGAARGEEAESWSAWAWSWLPAWSERAGAEGAPARASPVLVQFAAHVQHVSLVFKIMETEGGRKRSRGVLELSGEDVVVLGRVCAPALLRAGFGMRQLTLAERGACVCGHRDTENDEEPIVYLSKIQVADEEPWSWADEQPSDPEDEDEDELRDTAEVAESEYGSEADEVAKMCEEQFWQRMAPVLQLHYGRERAPPAAADGYVEPPADYEYSDWEEKCSVTVTVQPMQVRACTGLLHRMGAVRDVLDRVPFVPAEELPMRTLTVEECDALSENLPLRHVTVEIEGLRVRLVPTEHAERPARVPLVLELHVPRASVLVTGPLYPHRVCSAACQLPLDSGPLWTGARLHVTARATLQASVCGTGQDAVPRPCARVRLLLIAHSLLNRAYFARRERVLHKYTAKIREANVSGSAARLQAAWLVCASLARGQLAPALRHTTLAQDALSDDELVSLDVTAEQLCARGFVTKHNNTHFVSLHAARATAMHAPAGGEVKQTWLFSGPESPSTSEYVRCALQWCEYPLPSMIEFLKMTVQPSALSVDPLLVAWLAYRSRPHTPTDDLQPQMPNVKTISSSQYLLRRRATPPSSGRGGSRSGSGAELVHGRARSAGSPSASSPSERSERRDARPPADTPHVAESWLSGDKLLKLHGRLNRLLLSVEVGLVQVYVASATVSAPNCVSVRDAMERHAAGGSPVLLLCLGRLAVYSSSQAKYLWQFVQYDQPTYFRPQREQNVIEDSFPWKIRSADVACYTLQVRADPERSERSGRPGRENTAAGLRSQLRAPRVLLPRAVLDPVATAVTLGVVTKRLQIASLPRADAKVKHSQHPRDEDKTKYFTTGVDFKPSSLKEFIRGPVRRKQSNPEPSQRQPEPPQVSARNGPVVSLGVHLHADTPPIKLRLDQDQVQIVGTALHALAHALAQLGRPDHPSSSSHRNLATSASDMDARQSVSEETASENRSELISIFESYRNTSADTELKTFVWCQWVVSRATLVVLSPEVKLALEVDDVISSVDLQSHYNQLKLKVASASVRHYKRSGSSEEWSPGAMGGRVLEVREPSDANEENNFLGLTVTRARISKLPESWKEELHPKLLEQNSNVDMMWEVYATLAPLQCVLQPALLQHALGWLNALAPAQRCDAAARDPPGSGQWQWPYVYLSSGGLRLLLAAGEERERAGDDTVMLLIDKVTVNPHPENPICRQAASGAPDAWRGSGAMLEGRQYEVLVHSLAVRTAQFAQLASEEANESEMLKGTGSENPALKWSQPVAAPNVTPVLHSVDVCCIVAPAMYSGGAVACGPAAELNLVTDCALELGLHQLELAGELADEFTAAARERSNSSWFSGDESECAYAPLLADQLAPDCEPADTEPAAAEEPIPGEAGGGGGGGGGAAQASRSAAVDSGVETATSHSGGRTGAAKKSVSIACFDHTAKASDFMEVFVAMGTVELSLYAADDGSAALAALRPPPVPPPPPPTADAEPPKAKVKIEETKDTKADKGRDDGNDSTSVTKSLTDNIRNADIGKTKLEVYSLPYARKTEGNIPLIHATLHQPNLYYSKKKKEKTLQVSLFNAWVGLGAGAAAGQWSAPLLSTARGSSDPVTEIPPALATLRLDLSAGGFVPINSSSGRGAVLLDIERPILLEVCTDRLRRIKAIKTLIESSTSKPRCVVGSAAESIDPTPLLYKVRRFMEHHQVESVTIQMSQIGLRGSEGAIGWSAMTLQVAAGARPDRLSCRGLVTAASVSAGPETDRRHVVMQPLMAGAMLDATWEAWRKAEGGPGALDPAVRVAIDVDRITLDLRPSDIATVLRIRDALRNSMGWTESPPTPETSSSSSGSEPANGRPSMSFGSSFFADQSNTDCNDSNNHFYKDDLRSGAFKIVSGGQLPLAYQVTLHGGAVAWRYPQPRAVTRLLAFPIPELLEEVECALELYCPLLARWEPRACFALPVAEPRELQLGDAAHDAVFAVMWRVRVGSDADRDKGSQPYQFDPDKFMPRQDPLSAEAGAADEPCGRSCAVTAEQLSGALRVDSCFAPRLLPRARLALRVAALHAYAHNDMPRLPGQTKALEGYYVTRPLTRSHRVLAVRVRDAAAHALFGASSRIVFDTHLSTDVLDSATGTMEQLVEEFRVQGAVSLQPEPRLRLRAGDVRAALHVPRVCTLRALAADWGASMQEDSPESQSEREGCAADALEGRVSLWVHNDCAAALRVGQEGTDELVPLSAGASLAYRWRSPTAPKRIRFAVAGPSADWRWSNSIAFSGGSCRVRLEEGDAGAEAKRPGGVYLFVSVVDSGARRDMRLAGRLALANLLRHNLLYKVRARCSDKDAWQTISSGELRAESVGLSVLCGAEGEAVLKVKFTTPDVGWSGDIPLKECRKENMPWLVKVPSGGGASFTPAWCRVSRARGDARVLAAVWPLYVLRSHLPLDVDVLISSEAGGAARSAAGSSAGGAAAGGAAAGGAAPLVQTAAGRGACTHLAAPGTTAATHRLTFQYRNIECPVTREAVPLHYGVTDASVFEKPPPCRDVDDILRDIRHWLDRSARSEWPHSSVARHWPGAWQPALLQPRCDVSVRYAAVRAGGGCSLELRLCPAALLANAAPLPLTLRAHDAAPLCRLEPGVALAPPAAVLQKPFFLSVEAGRETFVSGPLQLSREEPGRYGRPAPGALAPHHPAHFAIHCDQKVALLTMCYELKDDINVLGITSTYVLVNRLPVAVMVSAMAVPDQMDNNCILRPKMFKVVEPTEEGSDVGTPLCRFWMRGRWRGGDAAELRAYLCVALAGGAASVPVRLGAPPPRRAVALPHPDGHSVAAVVTQQRSGARVLVTLAADPCPQFVLRNRTGAALAVAQPRDPDPARPQPHAHGNQPVREVSGALWWCEVAAGRATHYSTPAHCARYPPRDHQPAPPVPFLTVGRCTGEGRYSWSPPLAVTAGEQLLQTAGATLKVRVRTHPHSTLVELHDVDQHDISASDIRRRLLGAFSDDSVSLQDDANVLPTVENEVQRVSAYENLTQESATRANRPEDATILSPDAQTDALSASRVDQHDQASPENGKGGNAVVMTALGGTLEDSSLMRLSTAVQNDITESSRASEMATVTVARELSADRSEPSHSFEMEEKEWSYGAEGAGGAGGEARVRCVVGSVALTVGASAHAPPLLALHLQRAALCVRADNTRVVATVAVADVQVDNAQYETEQFDFAVVAATRGGERVAERWPPLWGMGADAFAPRAAAARLLLRTRRDAWTVAGCSYRELTEVEVRLGPLGLYVEDAFVAAAAELLRLVPGAASDASPDSSPDAAPDADPMALADARSLQCPLRLRRLHIHPLDLTVTLHTAVRMYIALDECPLRLGAFRLQDAMTSPAQLTHALTVHYLSATILGAGWVVGGLELLGAPGALAARVGGAAGGVRGVAAATAGALLRSLSAAASSLARNLDLLAGDDEHASRAAAARRRAPSSLMAGLVAGLTNFAINILGAVGGLAHHPLVGVAEGAGGGAALRRGLLGAIAKPLSATADLVAYAGHGLLAQAGWRAAPLPRLAGARAAPGRGGWRRDCVRWRFRLAELLVLAGFDVQLDEKQLHLLITHKFLVIVDTEIEKIVEMIDFKTCTLSPYQGQIIELHVASKRANRTSEPRRAADDTYYQVNAVAMARVARFTGATPASATRTLALLPAPARAPALHAALAAALQHNSDAHLHLL